MVFFFALVGLILLIALPDLVGCGFVMAFLGIILLAVLPMVPPLFGVFLLVVGPIAVVMGLYMERFARTHKKP